MSRKMRPYMCKERKGHEGAEEDERPGRQLACARCLMPGQSHAAVDGGQREPAKVPVNSACQLVQPSTRPMLAASLASPELKALIGTVTGKASVADSDREGISMLVIPGVSVIQPLEVR